MKLKKKTMTYKSDSVGNVKVNYRVDSTSRGDKVFFNFINKSGEKVEDFLSLDTKIGKKVHSINPETAIFNWLKSIDY